MAAPATASAEAAQAAATTITFAVGQRVKCRDGDETWLRGVVELVNPLRIHPDGFPNAYKWDEVVLVRPPIRPAISIKRKHTV